MFHITIVSSNGRRWDEEAYDSDSAVQIVRAILHQRGISTKIHQVTGAGSELSSEWRNSEGLQEFRVHKSGVYGNWRQIPGTAKPAEPLQQLAPASLLVSASSGNLSAHEVRIAEQYCDSIIQEVTKHTNGRVKLGLEAKAGQSLFCVQRQNTGFFRKAQGPVVTVMSSAGEAMSLMYDRGLHRATAALHPANRSPYPIDFNAARKLALEVASRAAK